MRVPHGLMFHHFHSAEHTGGQGSISVSDFERIIKGVGRERILSPDDWLSRLSAGTLASDDICLTFDDGLLSQYQVALPVMECLGLTAFWFVYSSVFEGGVGRFEAYRVFRNRCFSSVEEFYGRFFEAVRSHAGIEIDRAVRSEDIAAVRMDFPFYSANDVRFRILRDRVLDVAAFDRVMEILLVERQITLQELCRDLWMTATDLRTLTAKGHHVGLHSYSHPMVLADLPYEDQRDEYSRNLAHLAEVCGSVPAAAAHPVNSYNRMTLEILAGLGVLCGFRSNMTPPQGKPLNASPLELAREDHANLIERLPA